MTDLSDTTMATVFVACAVAGYGLATIAYLTEARGAAKSRRPSVVALALALLLHLAAIGAQCVNGSHPFKSVALVTSLGALLMGAVYIVLSIGNKPMRELGSVIAPCAAAALLFGATSHDSVTANPELSPTLVRVHVALATIGLAGFCLTAGIAGMYLALERRLRRLDLSPGMSGLSLQWLDRVHAILVGSVTPVFVLAVVVGAMALEAAGGIAMLSERGLELMVSGVAFVAVSTSVVTRVVWGVRGRKSAWLTMLAFLCMLLILLSYGVRQ